MTAALTILGTIVLTQSLAMGTPSLALVCDVNQLSDDERSGPPSTLGPKLKPCKGNRLPASKKAKFLPKTRLDAKTLRHRVDGWCGCQCRCFQPFRQEAQFLKLIQVQKTLQSMNKIEQDKYVIFSAGKLAALLSCALYIYIYNNI